MRIKIFLSFLILCFYSVINSICFFQTSFPPFSSGTNPISTAVTEELTTGNVFVLTANSTTNAFSYLLNQTTGQLTDAATSPAMPSLGSIAVTPELSTGNVYVAVTNPSTNTVTIFLLNKTTGAFTAVPGSPFATGTGPRKVTFSPELANGNIFAAVTNSTNVDVYSLNKSTGFLTPVPGSPFAAGTSPLGVAFTTELSSGAMYAVVANNGSANISVYFVNKATGQFTPVLGSPFATDPGPISVAISQQLSTGKVFVLVGTVTTAVVYELNITTGSITQVVDFLINVAADVGFTPELVNGQLFAGIVGQADDTFNFYSVNKQSGQFTPDSGSPFSILTVPLSLAFTQQLSSANNIFAIVPASVTGSIYVFKLANVTLSSATANCQQLTVTGSGIANATTNVFADGTQIGSGRTNASGNFDIEIATSLSPGVYSITVVQETATCTTDASNAIDVTISLIEPPLISSATIDSSGNLRIVGSGARPNALIRIRFNSLNIGSGLADSSGNFNITIPGTYNVRVSQTSGVCTSSFSDITNATINCGVVPPPVPITNDLTQAILNKYGCNL